MFSSASRTRASYLSGSFFFVNMRMIRRPKSQHLLVFQIADFETLGFDHKFSSSSFFLERDFCRDLTALR